MCFYVFYSPYGQCFIHAVPSTSWLRERLAKRYLKISAPNFIIRTSKCEKIKSLDCGIFIRVFKRRYLANETSDGDSETSMVISVEK